MLKKWQRDKLNAWIKEKTIGFSDAQGRYRCPMCGARDSFEITEPVAMLRVGPDGRLKQRVPVVRPGEEESLQRCAVRLSYLSNIVRTPLLKAKGLHQPLSERTSTVVAQLFRSTL